MVTRLDFLLGYAERVLGRALTDAESAVINDGMTRMDVRRALASLPEEKPKKKWSKPKVETTLEEDIEVVVNEVESGSGEGSE